MKTELMVRAVHDGGMRVRASDGQFEVLTDYQLDSSEALAAPTPLMMLLASLAACSLNSVMAVLKKMHQPVTGLEVKAHAIRSSEHPTVLKEISLEFTVTGAAVDHAAVGRALQLSEERLCPVWNMLKASTPIAATFRLEASTQVAISAI